MGIFSKRERVEAVAFPPPSLPSSVPTATWPVVPTLSFEMSVEVVGEHFYKEHLDHVMSSEGTATGHPDQLFGLAELIAILVPEPQNPHDRNAVGVHVGHGQAGHLSREDAIKLRPRINSTVKSSGVAAVRANLRTVGGAHWLILEPQFSTPMDAYSIAGVIEQVCDLDEDLVAPQDIGYQKKPNGYRLWGAGGAFDADEAKDLAKHLRMHGYKATARDDPDFAGYYVSVTGHTSTG